MFLHIEVIKILSHIILQKLHSFNFHTFIPNQLELTFALWCETRFKFPFLFQYGSPTDPILPINCVASLPFP